MTDESSYERMVLLASVAQSYYIARESQDDIAAKYGFSRSNVSRMLTEARSKGIVEISVKHPLPTSQHLESALSELWPRVTFTIVHDAASPDETLRRVGMAAWREIEHDLKPGSLVNLSWGRSIWNVVECSRAVSVPGARVVQIGGMEDATGTDETRNSAAHLGRRLGIEVVHFPAPLLADDAQAAKVLTVQSAVQAVIKLAREAEVTAVGIGAIASKVRGDRKSRFNQESLEELQNAGAVGDICGYHYGQDGALVDCSENDRVVGLGYDTLMNLPNRIGVAHDPAKAVSIGAALRGGWLDSLVTDASTAQAIYNEALLSSGVG